MKNVNGELLHKQKKMWEGKIQEQNNILWEVGRTIKIKLSVNNKWGKKCLYNKLKFVEGNRI